MKPQQRFPIQSSLVIVIVNGIWLVLAAFLAGVSQPVLLFAIGGVGTVILAAAIATLGRRALARLESEHQAAIEPPPPAPPVEPARPAEARPAARSAEAGAVQLLAILQREGRLVDFLQEDLRSYEDAQIGAAVRTVHEGCRQALGDHLQLEPIFAEAEGSAVTVPTGFDPRAVRLVGDVAGEPPFRGDLRHRGWRVLSVDLPTAAPEQDAAMILAAAQVEVR